MKPRINVLNAAFSYDETKNVFEEVSFQVGRGEMFCILGPNGVGKSTLLKCLCNLIRVKSGKVEIDGYPTGSMKSSDLARKIGFVPQLHYPVFAYTVGEVVLMGRTPHLNAMASPSKADIQIAEEAMSRINIVHLRDKLYTAISGGEMQLVLLARVLAQQADILLLDEPTSHLDVGNQIRILEVLDGLTQQGYSIVLTTHSPDQTFISDCTVAVMKDGHFIVVGPADEAVTEKNMLTVYGVQVKVVYVAEDVNRKVCVLSRRSRGSYPI